MRGNVETEEEQRLTDEKEMKERCIKQATFLLQIL